MLVELLMHNEVIMAAYTTRRVLEAHHLMRVVQLGENCVVFWGHEKVLIVCLAPAGEGLAHSQGGIAFDFVEK